MTSAACNGDPTGVWRLSSREESRFEFFFDYPTGGIAPACVGQNTRTDQTHDFLLELLPGVNPAEPGGNAALHYSSTETEVDFTSDCLQKGHDTCASVTDLECEDLDCGLCRCKILARDTVVDLSWSVDKGALTLTNTQGGSQTFSFCATKDQLDLQSSTRALHLVLERMYRAGRPSPCTERTLTDCGQAYCHVGECVGTDSCSNATDSVTCAKYPDCEWDATACSGTVPPRCTFRDYVDHTPGCELSEKAPHCGGAPLACSAQPNCVAKGCLRGSACTGGEQACVLDEGIDGCTCTSSTNCSGTFDCADLEQSQCESVTGDCKWSTSACIATATPCEQLANSECDLTAGCFLQAP
ncbi:MAG: hypothetical protein ABUL60_36425 [Myxococcales bacterium]